MRWTPRTWPSIRRSRPSRAALSPPYQYCSVSWFGVCSGAWLAMDPSIPPSRMGEEAVTPRWACSLYQHVESPHTGPIRSCWRKLAAAAVGAACGLLLTGSVAPGPGYADPPDPDLNSRIADASLRLERVVERYNAARDDLAETKARVRALTARAAPVNREVAAERRRVAHIAAMAYKNSPINAA